MTRNVYRYEGLPLLIFIAVIYEVSLYLYRYERRVMLVLRGGV